MGNEIGDDIRDTATTAISVAIRRAGDAKALSELCGSSYRQVLRWRDGVSVIGAEYALKVADAVDMEPSDFRPDIF